MLSGMFPAEAVVFLVATLAYGVTMKTKDYLVADEPHADALKGKARFVVGLGHLAALSMFFWAYLNFKLLAVVITFFVAQLAAALVTIGFVVPLREQKNFDAIYGVLMAAHLTVILTATTGWLWFLLTKLAN